MKLNKFCDYRDFKDEKFKSLLKDIQLEVGPYMKFTGTISRKVWETSICVLAMQEHGYLDGTKSILNIGSGCERIILYLSNRVKEIVCIDKFEHEDSREPLLKKKRNPHQIIQNYFRKDTFRKAKFNRNTIKPVVMDGLDLKFKNNTFDGIFSVSSMEHFGDLRLAYREVVRVLKPNGMFFISIDIEPNKKGIDRIRSAIPSNAKLIEKIDNIHTYKIDGINKTWNEAPFVTIGVKK